MNVCPALRNLVLAAVATTVNLSCSSARPVLNSERIEQRFGSYGVSIIGQSQNERLSGLYSESDDGDRTIRTLALVRFSAGQPVELQGIHERILCGASIGSTLKASGYSVEKHHELTSAVIDHESLSVLRALMKLPGAPTSLSVHRYSLLAIKDGQEIAYASIVEFHHPDYLSAAELQSIYGTHNGSPVPHSLLSHAMQLVGAKRDLDKCG